MWSLLLLSSFHSPDSTILSLLLGSILMSLFFLLINTSEVVVDREKFRNHF